MESLAEVLTSHAFELLLGAAAGLLAAFLMFEIARLWTHAVVPLWRRWRYQGVNVAGVWQGLGTAPSPVPGEWSEVDLALRQDASTLRGTMLFRHRTAARSFDWTLHADGRICDGYATLTLTPAGGDTPSLATALLRIDERGALTGQLLYRDADGSGVDVIDLSVHRTSQFAAARLRPAQATA